MVHITGEMDGNDWFVKHRIKYGNLKNVKKYFLVCGGISAIIVSLPFLETAYYITDFILLLIPTIFVAIIYFKTPKFHDIVGIRNEMIASAMSGYQLFDLLCFCFFVCVSVLLHQCHFWL